MTRRPLTGRRRFFKLAGLTASVAGQYAHSRVKAALSSRERAAEIVARGSYWVPDLHDASGRNAHSR